MKREQRIKEYKENHPIRETSGSGTGTWKWVRYLDGIDMRYGHETKAGAERARGKAARLQAANDEYNETHCPLCDASRGNCRCTA